MTNTTHGWMQQAIEQARMARIHDEVPVGAVIIDYRSNALVAAAHNLVMKYHDPTAHAEMLVIRQAAAHLQQVQLTTCDLYVTLEPCAMCAQAISHARIRRVYFGAYDPKSGGVDHGARVYDHATCHHKPMVQGGILANECGMLLQDFFQSRRG